MEATIIQGLRLGFKGEKSIMNGWGFITRGIGDFFGALNRKAFPYTMDVLQKDLCMYYLQG